MLLFRIVSDSTDGNLMSYSVRVNSSNSHLDNCIRERTAPNGAAFGLPSQGVERGLDISYLVGTLSTNANEPTHFTHSTHQIMRMFLISWGIAGLFGVAFVQTALESPHQSTHSGTQSYVRVVR